MPEALKPKYCHLREGDTLTLVVTPLYVIMSLCTILGNSLVIVSVMLFNNLRTPTNNFVVALALADLMVRCTVTNLLLVCVCIEILSAILPFSLRKNGHRTNYLNNGRII